VKNKAQNTILGFLLFESQIINYKFKFKFKKIKKKEKRKNQMFFIKVKSCPTRYIL